MTTSITSLPSASVPLTGTERVPMDQTVGSAVAASALVVGTGYQIESLGTTNWTACGLPAGVTAAVGLTFVATAAGTGTGTAVKAQTVEATAAAIAALAAATNLTYDQATRLLSSSTGTDVTLPLATDSLPGLESAADKAKLDSITVDRATLTVAPVRNNSGATIAKGVPVIVTGSSGTTKTIAPADASTEATAANTLGLTLDAIANNADGFVVTEGPLSGVNTAGLTEGQLFYLSETTGGVTSTRPTQPAHGVVLGWCVKSGAGTAGILYVKIDNGVELDELHDVLITSPTAGQVLRRASDGLWKNASLVATDISDSSSTGRAVLTAADATAARSAISAEQAGAAAAAQAAAVQRSNHTGTQPANTITGLAVVATTGAYSDLSGRPTLGTAAAANTGTAAGNVVVLDGAGLIPSALLPGFVDDVLEYANIAAFPVTGETGKLYVSLATNRVYRWSGSIYVEIAPSPGTTDAVTEGSVNLYFTNARARAAISVEGSLSYNPTTGVISYTAPTPFDPASPGPIGGTTPAAGSFTRLTLPAQGSVPSTPASGFSFYANSSNALSWVGANGYIRTFDGTANTANRAYTLPDASGTLALIGDAISATTTCSANLVLAGPASGAAAAPTFRALVAADLPAIEFIDLAYTATINIDFAAYNNRLIVIGTLTGNLSITFSNIVRGRQVTVILTSDGSNRTITYPGSTPFVGAKQTLLLANKIMIAGFTVYSSGGNDAAVLATSALQQ